MFGYRFLVDNDCRKVVPLLPKGRALNLEEVGLSERASDAQIIEVASERRYIIVTSNGHDFLEKINRFVSLSSKKPRGCHDVSGLVVVPNDHASQERVLPRAEEKLYLDGERITWVRVWEDSLYVRLRKEGSHEVRRLPRCRTCEKHERT